MVSHINHHSFEGLLTYILFVSIFILETFSQLSLLDIRIFILSSKVINPISKSLSYNGDNNSPFSELNRS